MSKWRQTVVTRIPFDLPWYMRLKIALTGSAQVNVEMKSERLTGEGEPRISIQVPADVKETVSGIELEDPGTPTDEGEA